MEAAVVSFARAVLSWSIQEGSEDFRRPLYALGKLSTVR